MIKKAPSLRELRNKLPENVVILPRAAKRRVRQSFSVSSIANRKALQGAQKQKFPFKYPGAREAEGRAAIIFDVVAEPFAILAQAILAELDKPTRLKIIERLLCTAHYSKKHRQAFEIANISALSYCQHSDLMRALVALQEQK